MAPWRVRFVKRLINPIYMGTLAIINITFSIILLFSYGDLNFKLAHYDALIGVTMTVNGFYFLDMLANFIVLRPSNVWNEKKFLYLELIF